ncbi:MAG: hypothetical protein JSV33_12540 [bacterium]|nr:MAG: hypothetical protein JSV33_12540 [bacterium]
MKTEMDVMNMDERQEIAWLRANRSTLMIVGAVWIGIIVWEFIQNRTPYFMITMVPVFAFIRFAFYKSYMRLR